MQKNRSSARIRRAAALIMAVAMVFCVALSVCALDKSYRISQFGMTVKLPRSFDDHVITRSSKSGDAVFSVHQLNYDEMTSLKVDNIYLQAYDPDGLYWITLTVTSSQKSKEINNYYDISASDRKDLLAALRSNNKVTVTSAVEVKHNGNIFFDTELTTSSGGRTVYIANANTVINGCQIDLTLQKYDEAILANEKKTLANMANSMEFDRINRNTGLLFTWWRLLLWIAVLVGVSFAASFLYKQKNAANRRRLEERRQKRAEALARETGAAVETAEGQMSFEEALGYQDDKQVADRVDTDLESFDISVRDKNPKSGIEYFEDGGESIDDGSDYFDTYFREPVEHRSSSARFFGTVGTYIKIVFRRIRYFFVNLFRGIFKRKRKKR